MHVAMHGKKRTAVLFTFADSYSVTFNAGGVRPTSIFFVQWGGHLSIFNKHAHQERPYIVIVDIDGAISEAIEDRLHLLPLPGKGALILIWTVWLVTGCCENARDKTRAWLRKK